MLLTTVEVVFSSRSRRRKLLFFERFELKCLFCWVSWISNKTSILDLAFKYIEKLIGLKKYIRVWLLLYFFQIQLTKNFVFNKILCIYFLNEYGWKSLELFHILKNIDRKFRLIVWFVSYKLEKYIQKLNCYSIKAFLFIRDIFIILTYKK